MSNSRGQTSAFHTKGEDLSINYQNSEETNVQAMPVPFERSTTFQLWTIKYFKLACWDTCLVKPNKLFYVTGASQESFFTFRSDKWHHRLLNNPPAKIMVLPHRNPSFLDTSSTGQHSILGWRDMISSKCESNEAICKCYQTSCKFFYPQVDRH